MNAQVLLRVWRDNWYLLLAVALCATVAMYKTVARDAATKTDAPARVATYDSFFESTGSVGLDVAERRQELERQKTLATIHAYERRIQDDPESEEAASLLAGMGNLYRQKFGDYEEAAKCYELLLVAHPDWHARRGVYVQLATCYERLGNYSEADRVYTRMREAFPEDSQEFQYAEAKLAGRLPSSL